MMRGMIARQCCTVGLTVALFFPARVGADEGMWLFDRPPVKQLEERHGFRLEKDWLEHLQKSSVRFNRGGSGSFVSAKGLVLTNHHVGAGVIASLSTPGKNLMEEGFLARRPEEELPCGDVELNVLMSIRDVTTEVNAALKPGMNPDEAVAARRASITRLEELPAEDRARKRRDVVTLYQGGAYHLYEFKRYSDVRLVFAPERQIAAFGGDPDNFEYPRYCLDCSLFRAYEDGKPAETPVHLKWSAEPAKEGELVFVSGHPGSTNRDLTQAEVERMRDESLPYGMERTYRKEVLLAAWSAKERENKRRALGPLTGVQNGRKSRGALLDGLLDPALMAGRAEKENQFLARLHDGSRWKEAAEAFQTIASEVRKDPDEKLRATLLSRSDALDSVLFAMAKTLVQAADDFQKPDSERQPEYREARRKILELSLFSDDPVYKDLETLKLGDSLVFLATKLGSGDPIVQVILDGKSPQTRAAELVAGCGLDDLAKRKVLYEAGKAGVDGSKDPMILLAKALDSTIRRLWLQGEKSGEVLKQAHGEITKARFALDGENHYPDATSSLRLAFGKVCGVEKEGVPFRTTFGDLYERAGKQGGQPPFDLSARWKEGEVKIGKDVSFNFISTCDITGGNSGSPVVNRKGELTGLVFDGNQASLVNSVAYDDTAARCVAVDATGIREALDKIYAAKEILEELEGL